MGNIFVNFYLIISCMGSCNCFIVTGIVSIGLTSGFRNKGPGITTVYNSNVIMCVYISKVGKETISLIASGDWQGGYKSLSPMGAINFILKPF